MKTIVLSAVIGAIVAVTSSVTGTAFAADDFATKVFEQQALYGENTSASGTENTTLEIFGIHAPK